MIARLVSAPGPMPLVRVRILQGVETLRLPAQPYAREATVKIVFDNAVEGLEHLELAETLDVYKEPEEKIRTAELPLSTLNDITVGELVDSGYGTNIVVHVKPGVGGEAAAAQDSAEGSREFMTPVGSGGKLLPDSMKDMMKDARRA